MKKEKTTVQERLAKISFFKTSPDFSSLKENEKKALKHCIQAAQVMTSIYLKQFAHGNLEMHETLKKRSDKEGIDLFRYFNIHGSPWDEYNHNKPFVPGVGEKPKFGSFYPPDLTEEEWNTWLNAHPDDRNAFENNYTVIKRKNNGLITVPYSEEYKDYLTEAISHLRAAASYLPMGNLRSFLELRADAFSSNDYFESDMAWIDTDGNPFEVTIGPYETYFDGLFGLKASFESFIALPDKDSTDAIKQFMPLLPDFDMMLSKEFNFRCKGTMNPLEVVADVMRGGELGFGSMFVAYNLPNDRRIHDLKGSKKVFSRTMMEAKFFTQAIPIAERILPTDIAEKLTFKNRLLSILGHELAHGLGPSKVIINGREIPFEIPMKDLHNTIEEAKADMLGVRLLKYIQNQGLINYDAVTGIVSSYICSFFQGWRHGFIEAHAQGSLIEYNWLKTEETIHYNTMTKKYEIDIERCIDSMSHLSTEFLKLQMAGSYDQTKAFMEQWGTVPPELPPIIESLEDIPTAVSPIYELNLED